jgi:hypothetical protein
LTDDLTWLARVFFVASLLAVMRGVEKPPVTSGLVSLSLKIQKIVEFCNKNL